jgi:hypothetical protein
MPYRNPPNRSAEYRLRADEVRKQADETADPETRETLLKTAATWERMAKYEDENNPLPKSTQDIKGE